MKDKNNPFDGFDLTKHRIKVYGRMHGYSHAVLAKKMRGYGLQLVWKIEEATHVFIGEKLGNHIVEDFANKPIILSPQLKEYFRTHSNSYLKNELDASSNLKKLLFSSDSKSRDLFFFFIEQEGFLPSELDIPLFTLSLVQLNDDYYARIRRLQKKYGREDLIQLCHFVLSKVKQNGRVKATLTKEEYKELKGIMKRYEATWAQID